MKGSQKRIKKDLEEIKENSSDDFFLHNISEDLYKWQVIIVGPPDTTYEGGRFRLKVIFPEEYPFKEPYLEFETKIYSYLVHDNGRFCNLCYAAEHWWNPSTTIRQVISERIMKIFNSPEKYFGSFLREDLATLYRRDKNEYLSKARESTKKYSFDLYGGRAGDPEPKCFNIKEC